MASEVSHNTSIEDNLDGSQDICYNSHDPAINGIIVDKRKYGESWVAWDIHWKNTLFS